MQGKLFEVEINENYDIDIKICTPFSSGPSPPFAKEMQGYLGVEFGFGVAGIYNKVDIWLELQFPLKTDFYSGLIYSAEKHYFFQEG